MTSSINLSNVTLKLSDDEHDALDAFFRDVITTANSTDSSDKDAVEHAVRQLYVAAGKEQPEILWCASPVQLPLMPLALQAHLLPDRKQIVQSFLGTERLDSLSAQLKLSDNDSRFSKYQRNLERERNYTLRERVICRIDLLERFHRLFVSSVQRDLALTFALSVVCQAHTDINNRLTRELEDQLTPRVQVLLDRTMDALGHNFALETRFGWRLREPHRTRFLVDPFETRQLREHSGLQKIFWQHVPWLMEEQQPVTVPTADHQDLLPVGRDGIMNFFSILYGWPMLSMLARFAFASQHLSPGKFRKQDETMLQLWWQLATRSPAYLFLDSVCFICERPTELSVDRDNRWHDASKPAFQFRDNFSIHAWHGVAVPPDVIEQPETITVERIDQEENAEIRRVMMERYGLSNYILDSGAEIIHEDKFGTLYRKEPRSDDDDLSVLDAPDRENMRRMRQVRRDDDAEAIVMVKVVNSSREPDGTFKQYFLRVPPTMKTAREAVAWTFGLEEQDYAPRRET